MRATFTKRLIALTVPKMILAREDSAQRQDYCFRHELIFSRVSTRTYFDRSSENLSR